MGQSGAMRIPAPGDALPRRDTAPARPLDPPAAPGRLPLVRAGRPLKRWRYVGVFGADLLLCAGRVRVAGVPQVFWAVWDRRAGVLRERTRVGPAALGRAVLLGEARCASATAACGSTSRSRPRATPSR